MVSPVPAPVAVKKDLSKDPKFSKYLRIVKFVSKEAAVQKATMEGMNEGDLEILKKAVGLA